MASEKSLKFLEKKNEEAALQNKIDRGVIDALMESAQAQNPHYFALRVCQIYAEYH